MPVLDGVRHWLMELAVTGFGRLDASTVLPFLTTLTQLREQPELARLSFLLTFGGARQPSAAQVT
jgi:hypothetical protein